MHNGQFQHLLARFNLNVVPAGCSTKEFLYSLISHGVINVAIMEGHGGGLWFNMEPLVTGSNSMHLIEHLLPQGDLLFCQSSHEVLVELAAV